MNNLCDKINKLPADLKKEVDDFVTFLIERNKISNPKSIKFQWRGGLRDNKNTCSSLELQHSIRKEWEENTSS